MLDPQDEPRWRPIEELEADYLRVRRRRIQLEHLLPLMRGENPFTLVEDDVDAEVESMTPARAHLRLVGEEA